MTLEEMEKMCRDAALSSHPHVMPLARALLAVLPVIEAAEHWRNLARDGERTSGDDCRLEDAVDTIRAALSPGCNLEQAGEP